MFKLASFIMAALILMLTSTAVLATTAANDEPGMIGEGDGDRDGDGVVEGATGDGNGILGDAASGAESLVGDVSEGVSDAVSGVESGVDNIIGGSDTTDRGEGGTDNAVSSDNATSRDTVTDTDVGAGGPTTGNSNGSDDGFSWTGIIIALIIVAVIAVIVIALLPKGRH